MVDAVLQSPIAEKLTHKTDLSAIKQFLAILVKYNTR